jgi:hypothetical protein
VADLTPLPTAQRPSDGAYQPVSGFAVAAGVVAALFVLGLAGVFYSAVMSHRAAMSYELLLLPAVGVGLAFAARSHVKQAEGTRSGGKIAAAAWWVCVLGGAGYGAYLYANEFFIERESRAFADKFFEQLKQNRPHHAYVFLVDPAQRDAASPDNPEVFEAQFAQGYGPFRNHELIRQIRRNGKDVVLEHVSASDIGQESEGFRASHLYRLTTPEGVFDVRLGLKAAEARKGGKPVWRIDAKPNMAIAIKPERLSQYGRLLMDLESELSGLARIWTTMVSRGQTFRVHMFTLPGAEREALENGLLQLGFMGGGPATIWPVSPAFLPEDRRKAREAVANAGVLVAGGTVAPTIAKSVAFEDLMDIGFFRRDEANTPYTPEQLTKLRYIWPYAQLNALGVERPLPPTVLPAEPTRFVLEGDELRAIVPIEWTMSEARGFYKASLILSCREPEVVSALAEARKKGAAAADDSSLTLRGLPPRRWKIVGSLTLPEYFPCSNLPWRRCSLPRRGPPNRCCPPTASGCCSWGTATPSPGRSSLTSTLT